MKRLRLFLTLCAAFCATSASLLHAQFVDTDNDRMDDSYETTHGLVVGNDDRHGDLDGDGYPNLAEYLKSTLASDPANVPAPDRIVGPGQTYTTITAAITSLTADDQIIMVKPGTYLEAVNNVTRRVFIISEAVDPNATIIKPASGNAVSTSKDLYLCGFTLVSPAAYGVSLSGVGGSHGLVQCVLRGHSVGLYSSCSSGRQYLDVIDTLIMDGSGNGMYLFQPTTLRMLHSTIFNCASGINSNHVHNATTVTNSILWSNAASQIGSYGNFSVSYSCVKNGYAGTGNISADPQLIQGYLSAASPCVNTASAAGAALALPEDLRGEPRVTGSAPDMGAHEHASGGVWVGDFDGDGLSDWDELYVLGSQFFSNDTDADRMADGYEVAQGLSVLVDDRYGDLDGDGIPNVAEFLKGTLAGDAQSVPAADRVVGAGQAYTTITAAINSLTADDQIILVKPGIYTELLNNNVRRVFLLGEHADPNAVQLQGSNTVVSSSRDLYIRGITISSAHYEGITLSGGSYHAVVQCILRGTGTGIFCSNATGGRAYLDVLNTMVLNTGAGVYSLSGVSCTMRMLHTTFSGQSGLAVNIGNSSNSTARNCIFWGTGNSQIAGGITVSNSCVKGTSVYAGTGNINTNPLLLQGYLSATSPCVNTGASGGFPAMARDLRGDPRISGAAPDMGAHEYGSGGSWAGDFDGDGLSDWDELYVLGSLFYTSDSDADRIADGYEIANGLSLLVNDRYGDLDGDGFPNLAEFLKGSLASDAQSVPVADRVVGAGQAYTTITAAINSLSADDQIILVKPGVYSEVLNNNVRRVFLLGEHADPNAVQLQGSNTVVSSSRDLYIRGITISGGQFQSILLNGGSNHAVVQCIIRGSGTCIGIYCPSATGNRAFLDVLDTVLLNGGDGVYSLSGVSCTMRLFHTTVSGQSGQAVRIGNSSNSTARNCIFWGTGASQISGGITVSNSCVKGTSVYAGTGNINTDPLLLQGYLSATSPCVNTGASGELPAMARDLRGDPRISGAAPDMGAHEYASGGSWAGDFDGDGLTDSQELYTHSTFFYAADTDGDRIQDGYEMTHGLMALADDRFGDADGDGFPNLAEFLKGSLASSTSSVPTADRMVGTGQVYTTISAAVTSLTTDDQIIIVKPGTYVEAVNITSRRVFLIAEAADPNLTKIQNGSIYSSTVAAQKGVYLRGFTLTSAGNNVSLSGSGDWHAVVQCILRGHSVGIYSSCSSGRQYLDLIGSMILDGTGNAIYAFQPTTLRMVHSTIFNCASGINSNHVHNATNVLNSILWSNTTAQIGSWGSFNVTYSCVKNGYAGTGNVSANPQINQGYIASGSPCINTAAATSSPVVLKDVRGDPRVTGAGPDMGAHEYSTVGSWEGDLDGDGLTDFEEHYTHSTFFYMADTDADRMNDGYEVTHSLLPLVDDRYNDKDGDGFPNLAECIKGTQASNSSSVPAADRFVGSGQAHATISSALASLSVDDQIILVKPGLYEEIVNNAQSNDALNRRVFLISENLASSSTYIRAIPGTGGAVRSRKDLYLAGFTVDGVFQDGVSLTNGGAHALSHCVFRGHRFGLGVAATSAALITSVDLINCLITDGRINTSYGSTNGINSTTPTRLRLVHTTITGHRMDAASSTAGLAINLVNGNHTVTVNNSILWCGGLTQVTGATTATYNNSVVRAATAPSGTGNVIGDPLLNQGKPGVGSSAINIGGSTPFQVGKDLALNARVFGTAADAGCYEFQRIVPSGSPSALYLAEIDLSAGTGDFDGDGLTDGEEAARGTDPFIADTDGDGVNDSTDRYPLDPNAAGTPGGTDTTAPTISISQPSGAVKL